MERRSLPRTARTAGSLCGLLVVFTATHPAGSPAQDLNGPPPPGWNESEHPDWERSAEPRVQPQPQPEEPTPSATLRVTPADAQRLEHELGAIRDRLLELRAERSRLNDELRQLGDVHGSLDEALWGPTTTSGFRAGQRRQEVEERERMLGTRETSLEEEERTLTRSRTHLERLLRELQRTPQSLQTAIT